MQGKKDTKKKNVREVCILMKERGLEETRDFLFANLVFLLKLKVCMFVCMITKKGRSEMPLLWLEPFVC